MERRASPGAEPLPRAFYDRATAEVAIDLLGRRLVCIDGDIVRSGTIVETEAYVGPHDLACHAARGRTQRTDVMFGPPGHAYVYLIYGMYHCFNAVTEAEGYPAAVLVRAIELDQPLGASADGPGKLCRALGIDRSHNREPLDGERVFIEAGLRPVTEPRPAGHVSTGPRINVDYAGDWAAAPLRFWLGDDRVRRSRLRPRTA